MNFEDKNKAYTSLQGVDYLEKDTELLSQKNANARSLRKKSIDTAQQHRVILWSLLDVATVDEIESNRGVIKSKAKVKVEEKETNKEVKHSKKDKNDNDNDANNSDAVDAKEEKKS